ADNVEDTDLHTLSISLPATRGAGRNVPSEITTRTIEPAASRAGGAGCCSSTVAPGSALGTYERLSVKPVSLSRASSKLSPMTRGTGTTTGGAACAPLGATSTI